MTKMDDKSAALKGGFWTSLSTAFTMLAQLLRIMILTRFLASKDFGVVSLVNMVIGLSLTFTDLGFASVIMYKSDLTKREFSSLFWLQFLFFLLIYALLSFFSPIISNFYEEPLLSTLIPIAALSIIGQAIGKLHDSVLLKKYQFKNLAFRNIITNGLSLFLAWWLAYSGYGVYSLIYSTLFQIVCYNIWNFVSGYRLQPVGFILKVKEVFPLLKIGVYQTGVHILDYISNTLDVMIIGKLLGTEVLGIYDLAKQLVLKFITLIRTVVSKVALPVLSNSSDDDNIINKFLIITKTVAYICTPVCVIIALFNYECVSIIYGKGYEDVAPLVVIFAVFTILTSITSFLDMLGITKGRTDLNFYGTIIRVVVSAVIIFIASHISITSVAWGQILILMISFTAGWILIVKRNFSLSFSKYIKQVDRFFIVMAIAYFSASTIKIVFLQVFDVNQFVIIGITVFAFVVIVLIGARLLLMDDLEFFKSLIWKRK